MKNFFKTIMILNSISKKYILLVISSAIFSSTFQVGTIYFIKIVMETLKFNDKNIIHIIFAIGIIFSFIITFVNSYFMNYVIPILDNKIDLYLKENIYRKNLSLNEEEIMSTEKYNNYYYTLENTQYIKDSGRVISNILTTSIGLFGISIIFILYKPIIVYIILVGTILSFLMRLLKEKYMFDRELQSIESYRRIDYINRIFYIPDYIKEIRNNSSDRILGNYKKSYFELDDIIRKYSKNITIIDFFSDFIKMITNIIVFYILCSSVISKNMDIPTFTMTVAASQEMYSILESFFMNIPSIYTLHLKIKKMDLFMENETNTTNNCTCVSDKINKIELKDIFYEYSFESKKNILKNISLKIDEKNRIIAITGENGSGKTTLLKIISGLYSPTKGTVYYNEKKYNELNNIEIRNHFYSVFQDFKLFPISIKDNFLYISNNIEYTDDEIDNKIWESLKLVKLDKKIENLPKKIDSILTTEFCEKGEYFSQGELQRLALARAFFTDREIILLDEPFCFGDIYYKENISQIIEKISKDKIVILVYHDDINKNLFDSIYTIKNGFLHKTK